MDQDFHRRKAGGFATGEDMLLEEDFSSTHFTDFHGGVPAGAQDAVDFPKGGGEKCHPLLERSGAAGHIPGIDAGEPATEPVVPPVVHHIQKGRGGDREGDGIFLERG